MHSHDHAAGAVAMRCVVFGVTGYLGSRLAPLLLARGHHVRVMVRDPAKLAQIPWRDRVEVCQGDVSDLASVRRALDGQDVLYYLVHSLMRPDFVEFDARSAFTVAEAAARERLSRIVYVGGIIPRGQPLSDHLASRQEVGWLLRSSGVPTVELRAAAVIGSGSASFEMLRYLTDRLPVMVAPRWLKSRIQPIAIADLMHYLAHAAELPSDVNRPFDVGGPDRFSYLGMIHRYAAVARLRRRIAVPVPFLRPRLSALWVDWVTPLARPLALSLMESVENDVVCADHDIAEYIPDPAGGLTRFDDAVALALGQARDPALRTRWWRPDLRGMPSHALPSDPAWAGGSLKDVVHEWNTPSDVVAVDEVISAVTAPEGSTSTTPSSWLLRCWRSEGCGVLRLRSDRLGGRLWLRLSARPGPDGSAVYTQQLLFQPYGLAGQVNWLLSAPVRRIVMGQIARAVLSAAGNRKRRGDQNATGEIVAAPRSSC